jgi:hypothetical protein
MPVRQPPHIPTDRVIPVFYPFVLFVMGRYRLKLDIPVLARRQGKIQVLEILLYILIQRFLVLFNENR